MSGDPALRVVDLRELLEAVFAEYAWQLRTADTPTASPDDVWEALPHTTPDNALVSLPAALMDHLSLPYPYGHETAASIPVDHPDFTAHLHTQAVRLTPAAAAYLTGLGAADNGPLSLRQRHETGMIAALALADADPTHLAADLGPFPDGMDWTHLLIPYRLNDFLYPTADEDEDDDPLGG